MKSPTGAMLERASILSCDSAGKPIPAMAREFEGVRCNETRPHALSSPGAEGSREEQLERDGRRANRVAELTDLERDVLRLQGKLQHRVEQRIRIAAGDLLRYLQDDYTLIPGSEETEERRGLPSVCTLMVVGYEVIQVEQLDYDQVAERLGVTVRQVKRAVVSAHKKLREATR